MKQQNNKKFAIYLGENDLLKVKKTFNSKNEAMQYYIQILKPLFEDLDPYYNLNIEVEE